ncbi:hypothetical protein RB195_024234 [Necator americanus]|uniref:Integrase catalytic domain-containing protein n=1 Tax=Necator americanus TaxID=51031 RepID=A0ABR1EMD3_NECAM
MADLPSRRVTETRPFENIGLDYFGLITVHDDHEERTNVYGCILTCCVSRLIHLEIVSDGTTEKFLNAFRRFVARRGKPHLVTCDNAPTFILGSEILNDSLTDTSTNEDIVRNMSNQMIEWKHNTPYSPWKGGFYERPIKSVKQALFKAIKRRILTIDQLHTFLVEIEGCLNCRPLTYQEDDINGALLPLRPIDFMQREMEVTLPFNFSEEERADPIFLPPSEALQFETRLQTEKALQSSYVLIERFWEKWKNHYLTALREQHRRTIDGKRGNANEVREGEIVLITDALQKRNHWKLARISKLVPSIDGAVREAEVYCSKKTLRRPINQLISLEIQGNEEESQQSTTSEAQQLQSPPSNSRCNLRPKKTKPRYTEEQRQDNGNIYGFTTKRSPTTWPTTLYLKMTLTLVVISFVKGKHLPIEKPKTTQNYPHLNYAIECKEQGLYIHAPQAEEHKLCVNNYCIREKSPPLHKLLRLPPEVLHDFEVNWKIRIGGSYTTVETACSAPPFCSAIDCTMCAANILNPECWPLAAIAGLGIILYLLVAICYTLCYIPITVGRPFRIIIAEIGKILDLMALFIWCCCQRITL